ncbi:hypothetical protein PRZ48_008791 [Zasmidium cellare]|uniref:Major facilitator superfamily (MFS) profile domain-containing protein n=1 Tax=Zasmidium cellare TaxID=395010 RepID=A0ABR0EGH3_ZASCE|nr:hypothetical protein PRZ48_008791 [Zasmidium cellare]
MAGAGYRILTRIVRNDAMKVDPPEIYNLRVFLLACASCFGGTLFGMDIGIIGGVITLPTFENAFGYSKLGKADAKLADANLSANIVSVMQCGAFLGALVANPCSDKWGRKPGLLGAAILAALGGMMQAASSGNLGCLYAGRFVEGLGLGAATMLTPTYISENAPRATRGMLVGLYQLFETMGSSMLEMQRQLEEELNSVNGGKGFWPIVKEMWTVPSNRKRAILSIVLMICQQMTGTNAINYYAPTIFTNLGITGTSNSLFATGIYGIVKMVACGLFLIFLADTLGRRWSFVWTGTAMAIAMFYLRFYVRFDPPVTGAPVSAAGYVALVMVYLFAAFFQFGWGPVCWIYVSEIPTSRLRGLNVSLAAATQWLFNLVVARATPVMLVTVGDHGYGTYFIFGSFCVCMVAIAWFFVPETKGISLERMDELFGGVDFGDIEDVGRAAQTGIVEKGESVRVEKV